MPKKDPTLLDKTSPITLDDLKDQFLRSDWSASTSPYNVARADAEHAKIYTMVREYFNAAWTEKLKDSGYKHPLRNYSGDYPIKLLEKSEGDYITGTIMEIMEDDTALDNIFETFFTAMAEPLSKELEAYAAANGKSVDSLTDGEIHSIIDKIADKSLSTMMGLLQQTQNVPEIIGIAKENGAYEDFPWSTNFEKADFHRKWYHTRTAVGKMLSLDEILAEGDKAQVEVVGNAIDTVSEADIATLAAKFIETLDSVDSQICYMRMDGKTNAEIAEALNYKTPSAVTKRLAKIKAKFNEFFAEQ